MKQPTTEELLSIESAEELISIRESLKNPKNNEKEKFIMFKASNEISKLYGKQHPRKIDNCPGCLTVIKKQLNNWLGWYDESQEPKQEEGKETEDEPITSEKINEKTEEIIEAIPENVKADVGEIVDLSIMKWPELKSYAAGKGINTRGKKKDELIEELNAK